MAKTYTYKWAVGAWSDLERLSYQPIDVPINGEYFSLHFSPGGNMELTSNLTPYKVYDNGSGIIYMTYYSSEPTKILRITEENT